MAPLLDGMPPAIGAMSVKDETHSASTAQTPNGVSDIAEYWVNLIRDNIWIAHTVRTAESDTEDEQPSISDEILNAPRRKSTHDALATQIAARTYPTSTPDSLAPIIKYEKDIVLLRSLVLEQRRTAITKASERNDRVNWIKRINKQGAWDEVNDKLSLSGASSLPMPVEVSNKDSLSPFFAHLRNNGTNEPASSSKSNELSIGVEPHYNTELIEFQKGVLYAGRRLDLCKMTTGPQNIGDLMESLCSNTFSRHFLLGNNIIGRTGAKAISSFIDDFPDRFETWYLAGNCIDTVSFTLLVNSMVKSDAITNVWLKRNPLRTAAAKDIFRLVKQTSNLRTLDLDQTELGDAGVAELFMLLADHDAPFALRHIYLNAVGIGKGACKQISRYLGRLIVRSNLSTCPTIQLAVL